MVRWSTVGIVRKYHRHACLGRLRPQGYGKEGQKMAGILLRVSENHAERVDCGGDIPTLESFGGVQGDQ